jgi:uncharacterized protein (DUF433 family)
VSKRVKDVQQMVVEDLEILRGTPVIRRTRIPVHDVASLVDSGTPVQEILEIYPSLTPSQIELTSIHAKASPQILGAEASPEALRSPLPRSNFVAPI